MSRSARTSAMTRAIPKTTKNTLVTRPTTVTDDPAPLVANAPVQERFLRSASLIDQERLSAHPVAIIGVGAIGSHLAEMLAKLGVREFTPDRFR